MIPTRASLPRTAACTAFALLAAAQGVVAGTYTLSSSTQGNDFFSDFSWQAIPDPTNGRVNYIDVSTAQSTGLARAIGSTFIMSTDDTSTLDPSGPGRNSQRIQSNQAYGTHVLVVDVGHMPQGLSTWPALWEVGPNWPYGGEIDVIEGVNDVVPNQSTLHTAPGCTIPGSNSVMTGNIVGTDCNAFDNGNAGCGIQPQPSASSYGPPFNAAGGGVYALERTNDAVNIWFWARGDTGTPLELALRGAEGAVADVVDAAGSVLGDLASDLVPTGGVKARHGRSHKAGIPVRRGKEVKTKTKRAHGWKRGATIDTSAWGTPVANFPNTQCDLADALGEMNIIINLTLCGDWAGAVFNQDGGSGDCATYVDENPQAFSEAYWEINYLNVYE